MKAILLLSLLTTGSSFVVVPHHATVTSLKASSVNDEMLTRLKSEYKELQQRLLSDLANHNKVDAEEVGEEMIKKASDVAALLRYKQQEIIDAAEKAIEVADAKRVYAHSLREALHREAMGAEREAKIIDSIDDAYEDLERVRDLAVSHADHHLEEDMKDLEIVSTLEEAEAFSKQAEATRLLQQLEQNEAELKTMLNELKSLKKDMLMKAWRENDSSGAEDSIDTHPDL